jgi:hypothetical protein
MCKNCHGRYDSMSDVTLTHDVISHRKAVLQSRLMEAIDREVRATQEIERLIAPLRTQLASLPSFWTAPAGTAALLQLTALSNSIAGSPSAPGAVAQLDALSKALAFEFPLAAAKVESLIEGQGTDAEAWETLDEGPPDPGYCARGDGSPALVSYATCPECGKEDYSMGNEEPSSVEDVDGNLVAYFTDADGYIYTPACKDCGHQPLSFELEDLCGYCAHQADKYADD